MPRQPPRFDAIQCQHCGAIVALAPPGVWRHTTHLTCPLCSTTRTVRITKEVDNNQKQEYTEAVLAVAPA